MQLKRPASQSNDEAVGMHLELPGYLPQQRVFFVQGWVASNTPVRAVTVASLGTNPFQLITRSDVEKAFPDRAHCYGFRGIVQREMVRNGMLALRVETERGTLDRAFPLADPPEEERALRKRKLDRIFPLLACPDCHRGFDACEAPNAVVVCPVCHTEYDASQGFYDLLPPALRDQFAPIDLKGVSVVEHDPRARALMDSLPNGLILDCGAGYRVEELPNVVHFELGAYPSTHVRGVNEHLPFLDASFDAVVSLAVLEHVENPFRSAEEMYRVLKPGGTLLCVAPLLVPVHGYPSHYYNMTAEGLRNLFPSDLVVVEQQVPLSGLPIFWLTWGLQEWVAGLHGKTREDFLSLRVRDLLENGAVYIDRNFVRELSDEKNFQLATTTMLIGKKP